MRNLGGIKRRQWTGAVAWAGAALLLSSCGVGDAFSGALSEEPQDTAEIVAVTPKAEAEPEALDLGLDPADVIQEGKGDSSTINRWGWPDTIVQPGDYIVHVQCRGVERLSFSFGTVKGSDRMISFGCGGPTWFSVTAPDEGYGFSINTAADSSSTDVEYIFAVTTPDVLNR